MAGSAYFAVRRCPLPPVAPGQAAAASRYPTLPALTCAARESTLRPGFQGAEPALSGTRDPAEACRAIFPDSVRRYGIIHLPLRTAFCSWGGMSGCMRIRTRSARDSRLGLLSAAFGLVAAGKGREVDHLDDVACPACGVM